jgi:hypothetical protein
LKNRNQTGKNPIHQVRKRQGQGWSGTPPRNPGRSPARLE